MTTSTDEPERPSVLGWIVRGWNEITPYLLLSVAVFLVGSLVLKQIRIRRWRQEQATFEFQIEGRSLARKVLENYNNLLETDWPLSESDRFAQAMEITAKQGRESLAEVRAKLERYTVAVRGGKIGEDKDLIDAAVAEGRFDLAADEAQRTARAAAAKRIELNRRNGGRNDSSSDSNDEETALLELAASTLRASSQDDLALPFLADALNLTNREEDDLSWADLQSQIGCTQLRIASHLASRSGRDHLDQGIAALRLADEADPRDHRSSEKSALLYTLGSALLDRAERSSDAEAVPMVAEAAHVLQRALDGQNAKDAPLSWIFVKQELVEAQHESVGQRTDFERLHSAQRAVESIRVCTERIDRGQAAGDWAAAQTELGVALLQLATGQPEKADRAGIADAIAVQHQALEAAPRDRQPRLWARTQTHLALALSRLGEATDENSRAADLYLEAAAADRGSLEVLNPEWAPLAWARTELNLARVLHAAVNRSAPHPASLLDEAGRARAAALTVFTEAEFPRLFAEASGLGAPANPGPK